MPTDPLPSAQRPKDIEDSRVSELVIDERTTALDPDEQASLELLKVMGHERLGETEFLDDARDGFLAVPDAKKDAEPVLVRKALGQKGDCLIVLVKQHQSLLLHRIFLTLFCYIEAT